MRRFHLATLELVTLVSSIALAASPALAQAAAPGGTAAPGTTAAGSGAGTTANAGHNWWWVILLILVVCAAIWYMLHGRHGMSGAGSSATRSGTDLGIDSDRIAGSAKQMGGSLEEGAGRVIGDTRLEAEGRMDQAEGKVQNTVGGVKDTLRGR